MAVDDGGKLPWVQVIGRIAVHEPAREPHEPTGSSRLLLCILVAAGPDGASFEEIASSYWRQERPGSWKIALRVSASHLQAQLPNGWNLEDNDGHLRLAPGAGFVDAWRVAATFDSPSETEPNPDWLDPGLPFEDIDGIELIDVAVSELTPLLRQLAKQTRTPPTSPSSLSAFPAYAQRQEWLRRLRRAIVIATPQNHQFIADASSSDSDTQTHVIVGDRRLLLPLGPFAMTFRTLRNEIQLEQGVVDAGSVDTAFRLVTNLLNTQAADRPQRLLVANAPELDTTSLRLTSMLIDRGWLDDFSLVLSAHPTDRDIRWLDFIHRSTTAGCQLVEFARN